MLQTRVRKPQVRTDAVLARKPLPRALGVPPVRPQEWLRTCAVNSARGKTWAAHLLDLIVGHPQRIKLYLVPMGLVC